jgi:hypothetical protein
MLGAKQTSSIGVADSRFFIEVCVTDVVAIGMILSLLQSFLSLLALAWS